MKIEQKKNNEISPIPELPEIAGWKEVPIVETEVSHEPLVPIGIFSDHPNILSSSVYANEHHNSPYHGGLEGSNMAVFMREGVAIKLEKAASMLPHGQYLLVMDAYRSLEVQGSLYEQYTNELKEKHPDWTEEQLSAETQKYVSIPSSDPNKPSPHNTGASVDVVIVEVNDSVQSEIEKIDARLKELSENEWQEAYFLQMKKDELWRRNAKMLNFGTLFDNGGPDAALRHFEVEAESRELTSDEEKARQNRQLLYNVMISAGLEPYAEEWWHYNDPASQMGAKIAGREYAEYGAIQLSDENREFADMRRAHHVNSVRLARGEQWTPPKGLEVHYKLARAAVLGNNPKNIWAMTNTVESIEPPKNHDQAA